MDKWHLFNANNMGNEWKWSWGSMQRFYCAAPRLVSPGPGTGYALGIFYIPYFEYPMLTLPHIWHIAGDFWDLDLVIR